MKTLTTLVLVLVTLVFTNCASANFFPENHDLDQSTTKSIQVVGVVGVSSDFVKGNINAANVDQPTAMDEVTVRQTMKEKGLDYLLVVNTEEKTEHRNSNSHSAKKAALFALSLVLSAVSHSSVNLDHDKSSVEISVKVVTTNINLYGQDGKQIRSNTTVKEMNSSEIIPTNDVAVNSLKEFMAQN